MRISHLHNMVKEILTDIPGTRSSDAMLQCEVIGRFFGKNYLMMPYSVILLYHKELPSIESVGRARRKCQELYPELRADADVEAMRMVNEGEFEDYARNTVK